MKLIRLAQQVVAVSINTPKIAYNITAQDLTTDGQEEFKRENGDKQHE